MALSGCGIRPPPNGVQVFTGHRRGVTAVTMTPDRRIVISASDDRTIRFWKRATGKCLRVLKGHKHRVTAVLVTPDGRFLLSASADQTLRFRGGSRPPMVR